MNAINNYFCEIGSTLFTKIKLSSNNIETPQIITRTLILEFRYGGENKIIIKIKDWLGIVNYVIITTSKGKPDDMDKSMDCVFNSSKIIRIS